MALIESDAAVSPGITIVQVPRLPRDALVEIVPLAMADKVALSLRPQTLEWNNGESSLPCHFIGSAIPQALLIGSLSFTPEFQVESASVAAAVLWLMSQVMKLPDWEDPTSLGSCGGECMVYFSRESVSADTIRSGWFLAAQCLQCHFQQSSFFSRV